MAISNEDILEAIAQKPVMEVVELISMMEEKFGVTAAVPVAIAAGAVAGGADSAVEEKTEFNVVMTNFGANKVGVIKAVRAITNLGLKEAKDLVEGTPANIKEGVSKAEAADIKKQLEEAGATVEVK